MTQVVIQTVENWRACKAKGCGKRILKGEEAVVIVDRKHRRKWFHKSCLFDRKRKGN